MGQGVYTAIAMILAEELDADFAKVTLEHAPPDDKLYGNPMFGIQATGNSNSIRAWWKPIAHRGRSDARHAGGGGGEPVAGRPASCRHRSGEVDPQRDSGRTLAYGELALAASGEPAAEGCRR